MRAAAWTQRKLRRITASGCATGPWRAGNAASSIPLAGAPLFLDAAEAGLDRLQAVVQPQARGLERAVVGQGTTHRRAVALHDLRLRVAPALDLALDPHAPSSSTLSWHGPQRSAGRLRAGSGSGTTDAARRARPWQRRAGSKAGRR